MPRLITEEQLQEIIAAAEKTGEARGRNEARSYVEERAKAANWFIQFRDYYRIMPIDVSNLVQSLVNQMDKAKKIVRDGKTWMMCTTKYLSEMLRLDKYEQARLLETAELWGVIEVRCFGRPALRYVHFDLLHLEKLIAEQKEEEKKTGQLRRPKPYANKAEAKKARDSRIAESATVGLRIPQLYKDCGIRNRINTNKKRQNEKTQSPAARDDGEGFEIDHSVPPVGLKRKGVKPSDAKKTCADVTSENNKPDLNGKHAGALPSGLNGKHYVNGTPDPVVGKEGLLQLPVSFSRKCAEKLRQALQRHDLIARTPNMPKWAESFTRLVKEVPKGWQHVEKCLDWFVENLTDQYTPVAYCGASFRRSFDKIAAAMERSHKRKTADFIHKRRAGYDDIPFPGNYVPPDKRW